MSTVLLSIAPIFALVILGHLLQRNNIPDTDFWNLNDRLVYWVLMPALLFYKTSTIQLSLELVGSYAAVIFTAFFGVVIFAMLATRITGMSGPRASSTLQGAARHNTFIALAIAERLYGTEGLSIAAIGTALLIPLTNVSVVSIMVCLLRQPDSTGGTGMSRVAGVTGAILRDIARNPILLSVILGVSLNLSGVGMLPVVHDVVRILGAAALPIVLLCVGANLQIRGMASATAPLIISCLGKLALFPAIIVFMAQVMGLSPIEISIALLFGAVPTASSAYTLARQMGGDAPLMAAIVTIQTGLSFLTLPLTISLVQGF